MKRKYNYIHSADVRACRDMARIMIDLDLRKGVIIDECKIKYTNRVMAIRKGCESPSPVYGQQARVIY